MTDPSLPPGTTHADIERHFGDPETAVAVGDVTVCVETDVAADLSDDEIAGELIAALQEATDLSDDAVVQIIDADVAEVRE